MLKFTLKAIIFLCPIAIVFFYIESRLRKIPTSYSIKEAAFQKNKNTLQTIILGGSHALYSINPDYIDNSINLANASQSIYYDCKILESKINDLPNIKNVIFNLSKCSYYYNMNDGKEKLRTYAYKLFWGIDNTEQKFFDLKNYSAIAFLGVDKTLMIAKGGFKQIDAEGTQNLITDRGFLNIDSVGSSSRISDSLGVIKAKYHLQLIKEKNLENNIDELKKVLKILQEKKVNVYFTYTPTFKTYNSEIKKYNLLKIDSLNKYFETNYNVKVLDYSCDTSYQKNDFYDNDHLNKYGAEKFSKQLNNIITK